MADSHSIIKCFLHYMDQEDEVALLRATQIYSFFFFSLIDTIGFQFMKSISC